MASVLGLVRRATIAVMVVTGSACAWRNPNAAPIRVLVYNIHAGKDAAGADNIERVADIIRRTSADIVLLQEVDRGTQRSAGVDQLSELTRRVALHGAFGKSLSYQGGDYGIAILARWPIVGHATLPLVIDPPQPRAGGSYEPRVALRTIVRAPIGDFTIVNTHLDASRDDRWRRQEVARVLSIADSVRTLILVGGDFNSTPESEEQQSIRASGLRDAWLTCGVAAADRGFTYPADSGVKRIDYLFFRDDATCTRAEVIATQASDHRPLLVHIIPRRK